GGEPPLILAPELVVGPVGLAGRDGDPPRWERIHGEDAHPDDGDGEHHRDRPEREPALHRLRNSSFMAASLVGSASRSTTLRAISLAPASSPSPATGAAGGAPNPAGGVAGRG